MHPDPKQHENVASAAEGDLYDVEEHTRKERPKREGWQYVWGTEAGRPITYRSEADMNDQLSPLARLEAWYASQCNGEWEHEYGLRVSTLDNPGWDVRIDLRDTALAAVPFQKVEWYSDDDKDDWIVCQAKDGVFYACGGPRKLVEIVEHFVRWADRVSPLSTRP